jgi:hypothetical protein
LLGQINPALLRLLSFIITSPLIAPLIDPLIPKAMAVYLSSKLRSWVRTGQIKGYSYKIERITTLTYKIRVRIAVGKDEAKKQIVNYIYKTIQKTGLIT